MAASLEATLTWLSGRCIVGCVDSQPSRNGVARAPMDAELKRNQAISKEAPRMSNYLRSGERENKGGRLSRGECRRSRGRTRRKSSRPKVTFRPSPALWVLSHHAAKHGSALDRSRQATCNIWRIDNVTHEESCCPRAGEPRDDDEADERRWSEACRK